MIIEVKGDIFNILEEYNLDAIVNPVNCVGVMGKGLALEFKNRFPDYYINYYYECKRGLLGLNNILYCCIPKNDLLMKKENNTTSYYLDSYYIFSFPTKYHWKDKSNLNQISKLISRDFIDLIYFLNIKKVGLPYLGCGLGEIDKEDFKTELYKIHNSNETFKNIEFYLVEYNS